MLDKRTEIMSSIGSEAVTRCAIQQRAMLTSSSCKQRFRPIRGQQQPLPPPEPGGQQQPVQPQQQQQQQQKQATAGSEMPSLREDVTVDPDRIYVPSFATEKAMCGEYAYARQLYDCWIAAGCEPDDYRIFFNRAICNYELEDYDQALSDVNVAIRLKDKWPKGHYVKGKILSELKKYQAAEDSFLMSLKLDGYENPDTESRIRKNIFMALVQDGFDATEADHASCKQATYEDAKDYLMTGSFVLSLEMARSQKAANLHQLNRKVGRILPTTWFTRPPPLASRSH